MSAERIRELLQLMNDHDLVELELEEGDFKLRMKKPQAAMTAVPMAQPVMQAPVPAPGAASASTAPASQAEDDTSGLVPINSPIVGTFYRAPSPDDDPFVDDGVKVTDQTVVCIVEAMKIMNEVKAGVKGTIKKILVENGEPVEYGQPLFMVDPS